MQEEWGERGMRIPLDIVEAPFRDLTAADARGGPAVHGAAGHAGDRRVPEFVVSKWRHLLLHNQNALFVKRLFLFEPKVVLSSVPFALASTREVTGMDGSRDAHALARERCLKETTVRHLISVEGVMRALARRFGRTRTCGASPGCSTTSTRITPATTAENHARLAAGWLREAGSTSAWSTACSLTPGPSTGPT